MAQTSRDLPTHHANASDEEARTEASDVTKTKYECNSFSPNGTPRRQRDDPEEKKPQRRARHTMDAWLKLGTPQRVILGASDAIYSIERHIIACIY